MALIKEQAASIPQELVPHEAEDRCVQLVQERYTTTDEHAGFFRECVRRCFRSMRTQGSAEEEDEFEIQDEWILERTNTGVAPSPSTLGGHPIFQMGPQQLGALVPELALEIVRQLGRDRELQNETECRHHEKEVLQHRSRLLDQETEILRMQMLREERHQEHERAMRELPPMPAPPVNATTRRRGPEAWSDDLLHRGWYGNRYVSLSAAFCVARPPAERDTPSLDLCDRLAALARTPGSGLDDAVLRSLEVATESGAVRSLTLLYLPRRSRPDVKERAQALWRRLLPPEDLRDAPVVPAITVAESSSPSSSATVSPRPAPAPKRRRTGADARPDPRSLRDAVLAPFPPEAHDRLYHLLITRFVEAPALEHWKGTVWERVGARDPADREDVVTRLDVRTHPLVPALVGWLARCQLVPVDDAGVPLPPAPVFPLPSEGRPPPGPDELPLDVWGCWTTLSGSPTGRALSDLLHRHGCAPPTALAPASAYLLAPLEPERVAFLHAAGHWLPYAEIATVLGWTGPLRRAFHVVPLLARGWLTGVRDEQWRDRGRDPAGRPLQYCWSRCLGAWRRAAVLHDALQAMAARLPMERVSVELHRVAGF